MLRRAVFWIAASSLLAGTAIVWVTLFFGEQTGRIGLVLNAWAFLYGGTLAIVALYTLFRIGVTLKW